MQAPAIPCGVTEKKLNELLDRSYDAERSWANTWGFIWTGAAVAQAALMPVVSSESGQRTDLAFGSVASLLGLIPTWIYGPVIIREHRALLLARQEKDAHLRQKKLWLLLEQDAQDKKLRRSGLAHAGNVLLNMGLGALLGTVFRRPGAGFLLGLTGIPVGIVMLETQPRSADAEDMQIGVQADLGHGFAGQIYGAVHF